MNDALNSAVKLKLKEKVMTRITIIRYIILFCLNFCILIKLYGQDTGYINDMRGYISIYTSHEKKSINKLSKNLSKGACDTCYIYVHLQFFMDKSIEVDSVSYNCINNKILSKKALSKFQRTFMISIDDTKDMLLPFEPYETLFQLSMEVGHKRNNEKNRWETGHSRSFNN